MDNVEIKLSKNGDFFELLGESPKHTCRAWSVFIDEELVCIVGVMRSKTIMVAFSYIKEGVKVSNIKTWRIALLLWHKIKSLGYSTMYAVASPQIKNSSSFLKRLGWKHIETRSVGEIFLWQIQ